MFQPCRCEGLTSLWIHKIRKDLSCVLMDTSEASINAWSIRVFRTPIANHRKQYTSQDTHTHIHPWWAHTFIAVWPTQKPHKTIWLWFEYGLFSSEFMLKFSPDCEFVKGRNLTAAFQGLGLWEWIQFPPVHQGGVTMTKHCRPYKNRNQNIRVSSVSCCVIVCIFLELCWGAGHHRTSPWLWQEQWSTHSCDLPSLWHPVIGTSQKTGKYPYHTDWAYIPVLWGARAERKQKAALWGHLCVQVCKYTCTFVCRWCVCLYECTWRLEDNLWCRLQEWCPSSLGQGLPLVWVH